MNKDKQSIIDTISKILIQAADQEGTPEGNTFKSNAARLMAKYRIKESEVDLETDNFILDKFEFASDGKGVPQWVGRIVGIFAHIFDCQSIVRRTFDGKEWEMIGTFSDVETALYFVNVCCHHIEKESWKTWHQKTYRNKREQLGNVASSVIWERSYELKNEMDKTIHEDKGCTALVIQKEKEIAEAVAELYPNLTTIKSKKLNMPNDAKTRNAGTKAGESAPLNFAIGE